jgi:hypothetical protein
LRPLVVPAAEDDVAVVAPAVGSDPPESERATITATSPAAPIATPMITGPFRMRFMAPTMAADVYSPKKAR